MRGAIAIAGFVLGALVCLIAAAAEWGAWMLVAPGRRLGAAERDSDVVLSPGEPIEAWTEDGLRLAGVFYPSALGMETSPGRTAIVIHGFAEDPQGFRDRAEALARRGWNAAAIDLRGHGQSQGEHTSFGGRESDDLHAWINVLAGRLGPALKVAVWGRSMGAAVALRAAAEDEDARIEALVLEAPYHDLEAAIMVMIRRFRVPGARWLARLIAWRAEALAGVSLTRPRPLDLAPRVTVPALIVHGSNDTLVPLAAAQRLADAFPTAVPLLEIAGARHTDLLEVGGLELLDRITAFLDRVAPC